MGLAMGLDFAAIAQIHAEKRNRRAAGERIDELLGLAEIGRHTAGHQAVARFHALAAQSIPAGPDPISSPATPAARGFYFADLYLYPTLRGNNQ